MTITSDNFAPAPDPSNRVISASAASPQEEAIERALRPKLLDEYVGQVKIREQLEIFIGAAKKRWITCCCLVRLDLARPRCRTSWRMNWA